MDHVLLAANRRYNFDIGGLSHLEDMGQSRDLDSTPTRYMNSTPPLFTPVLLACCVVARCCVRCLLLLLLACCVLRADWCCWLTICTI